MSIEKKLSNITSTLFNSPRKTGFCVFLFLLIIIGCIANQRYWTVRENEHQEMSRILHVVKDNIDQSLKNSYTAALTLGLTVRENNKPFYFDTVAAQLKAANPSIQSLQLVPNGIVKYIYPIKGNEKALNANVFKLSELISFEAKRAIQSRHMFFAGPVSLLQGGTGIIGRMPIFINDKFWGFAAVVVKLDVFLKQAGIYNKEHRKYQFQLSKVDPLTHQEVFFLPQRNDLENSLSETVKVPDGNWKVYVVVSENYHPFLQMLPPLLAFLVLAAVCSFLISKLFKKPAELQLLVYNQASKLLENDIKFKTIFDKAGIGIMEVDSNTGYFLQVNDKICELFGYTEAELYRKDFKSITHPGDQDENLGYFDQMRAGEIREFEFLKRFLHRDGHIVWVNIMITPLWKPGEQVSTNIAIVEDVTERKVAEEIAAKYQHRIESLINTIDGVVWESDPRTLNFTFVSEKSIDILGYTPDEWVSTDMFWADHIHPEDRDWVVKYCMTCARKQEQHDFEYRMIASDGSIVWLRDIVNVITENGKAVLLRGIMIDISSQKQAERDLRHSFNLVNEQNKRLLNFSYIVSHNLRSHTSNIQSISNLIEMASTDEDRMEMVTLLKTVSAALNETLLNLNEVVNIQTNINVVIEPLNLRYYIDRTLDVLHDQITFKKVTIINKVNSDILVQYNPAYLESILLNFIFNAIRYSHPERTPLIELSCHQEDMLVLQISDNGIGMDLEKYGSELFGMYKTFTDNPDSKGVGLFISKNQIDAMGGRVSVVSEVNQGSTFKIYFK